MTALTHVEKMDDRAIQNWLRKADPTTLAIALLGASGAVRSRVMANMSKRAATLMAGYIDGYAAMDAKELLVQKCAKELETLMENGI
jgi:flagellar motor switch protein FliG